MMNIEHDLANSIADIAQGVSNSILTNLSMMATVTPEVEVQVRTQVFAQTLTRCTKEMEKRIDGHFA